LFWPVCSLYQERQDQMFFVILSQMVAVIRYRHMLWILEIKLYQSDMKAYLNLNQRFPRLTGLTFLLLTFPVCMSLAQQKLPATHLHFNDDTSKLQFAIISDLWGGYRPGIFEDAIDKLELLQPQFVMSVGDLIDGKIYDSILLDEQWSEFNEEVNSLSMPFFTFPEITISPIPGWKWSGKEGLADPIIISFVTMLFFYA
jgi:hypothetical protein